MRFDAALMWFRRDLRLADNAALYHALKCSRRVYCVFIFDRAILNSLPSLAALPNQAIHAPWIATGDELRRANVLLGECYPLPIVDHTVARTRTLARFGAATGRVTPAP